MALPVPIHIMDTYKDSDGDIKELDVFVSDDCLYNKNIEQFELKNLSELYCVLGEDVSIKKMIICYLNTIMCEEVICCNSASKFIVEYIKKLIKKIGAQLTLVKNEHELVSCFLSEKIIASLVRGVYSTKKLPDNEFLVSLKKYLYAPDDNYAKTIKEKLQQLYGSDLIDYAKKNVAALVGRNYTIDIDLFGTIREYFIEVSEETIKDIEKIVRGGFAY